MNISKTLICVVFALFAGMQAANAGQTLSSGALKKLFPGTFSAVVDGYTVQITANGNGRLYGNFNGMTDKGRWYVTGGKLCIKMTQWLEGRTRCSRVWRDGVWYKAKHVKFRRI